MDLATIALTLQLIQILTAEIPNGIQAVQAIMLAWNKADPTAQDFDALAAAIDQLRPKDPLGKV